jgi:uncharacterized delta-60 repeat protein
MADQPNPTGQFTRARRPRACAVAAFAGAERLEPRYFLSIADPDPTFGSGGSVTLPFEPEIVRLQPNGEVLAASVIEGSVGPDTHYARAEVVDLAANGSVKWEASLPIGGFYAGVETIAAEPNGQILLGGVVGWGGQEHGVWLTRLNADGSVDESFRSGFDVNELSVAFPKDIAVQPNGQIVACGGTMGSVIVVRLNADGTRDGSPLDFTRFADRGDSTNGSDSTGNALAIQPDGKILLAGVLFAFDGNNYRYQLCLRRFNPRGSVDTTFASGGTLVTDVTFDPGSIELEPSGEILVAARGGNDAGSAAGIAAITPDGRVDSSFGWGGLLSNPAGIDTLTDVKLQPHGTFLVTGTRLGHPIIARYSSAGVLDLTFGHGGAVEAPTAVPPSDSVIEPLLLGMTGDNKLVEWSGDQTVRRWVGLSRGEAPVGDSPPPSSSLRPIDALPPVPTLEPLRRVATGGRHFKFTVTYHDFQSGVSAASVRSGNIVLRFGNNKSINATLASATPVASPDGSTAIVATYAVRPPGGEWSSRKLKVYNIQLVADQVADNAGNAVPQTFLGSFTVPSRPPQPAALTRGQRTWV